MTSIPWAPGPAVGGARRRPGVEFGPPRLAAVVSGLIPLLAAGLVGVGTLLGWRGGDLPAQIYRVEAVRRNGLALWDSQWFAGHWMLGYSVLYPSIAAAVGLGLLSVISAAAAALAFHRLVVGHFALGAARAASLTFTLSVIVETAIGQLPFLAGEAAGLWCCVALARRRPAWAVATAVFASLLSPLAAAFVALAAAAWLLAAWWPLTAGSASASGMSAPASGIPVAGSSRTLGVSPAWGAGGGRAGNLKAKLARPGVGSAGLVVLSVGVPLGIVGLLFPGQGPMPYPLVDCVWELVIAAGLWLVAPRQERVLRAGIILFVLSALASLAVPSALGGNVGRAEDCVALPLTVALLWPRRRVLLAFLAVPLVLSQWGPAWSTMSSHAAHPQKTASYYQPLIRWLHHAGGPLGRVEVVPTADHWESAYVAPTVALARGWERQLDVANNPIFYDAGLLHGDTYLQWLLDNGVRYVALPSAPLDYAGVVEGRVVAAGVPGLRQVMHTPHWRVYQVDGATGIVSGPGYLTSIDGSHLSVTIDVPGTIEVRVHDNPAWRVAAGAASIEPSVEGWILVHALLPGPVDLAMRLPVP